VFYLFDAVTLLTVSFSTVGPCSASARTISRSDRCRRSGYRRAEDDNRTDAVAQPDAQTVIAADAPRSRRRWAAAAVNASAFLTRLASADWATLAATVPGPFYQSPVDPLTHKEAN
jgi:hypothetical protein